MPVAYSSGLAEARHARKTDSRSPLRMRARVYAGAGAPESAASARQRAESSAARHKSAAVLPDLA
jgi:hypothetical protein